MSYSQNGEDKTIVDLLVAAGVKTCRFLDVGAHDGVTFSNTRKLAEAGWGGTLVEPSPSAFASLMAKYDGRQDVSLVHVAILADGPQRLVKFYDSHGDMVSTIDEGHRQLWEKGSAVRYQPISVAGISVAELLAQFPGPYPFLNLDVEGMNLPLFRAMPLREMGVVVACVEYETHEIVISQLAFAQGYEVARRTSENLILRLK